MEKVDSVVMWGGGIDSAAIVELMHEENPLETMLLLYIDYGAKAANGECNSGFYYAAKYRGIVDFKIVALNGVFKSNPIIDAAMTSDHKDDYIPGRNFVIGALAYGVAERYGAKRIYFGGAPLPPGDPMLEWAKDMQQPFVDGFNVTTAWSYGGQTARMIAPLLRFDSKEVYVKRALAREPRLFEVTFSCYQSRNEIPCGVCAHCVYRAGLKQRVGA